MRLMAIRKAGQGAAASSFPRSVPRCKYGTGIVLNTARHLDQGRQWYCRLRWATIVSRAEAGSCSHMYLRLKMRPGERGEKRTGDSKESLYASPFRLCASYVLLPDRSQSPRQHDLPLAQ